MDYIDYMQDVRKNILDLEKISLRTKKKIISLVKRLRKIDSKDAKEMEKFLNGLTTFKKEEERSKLD